MMGPSAIGAQPPPEEYEEAEQEPEEPWCTCCAEHSIEEMDTNCCDSCGKPIYDEEHADLPAPTFKEGTEK